MTRRFTTPGLPWFRALTATTGLLLTGLAMGSCALFSPGDEDVYVLVRAHGEPVPVTVLRLESPDSDDWREYRILGGRLTLTADGRWQVDNRSETVINGHVSHSDYRMTGQYERRGDDLVLFHSGPGFNPGDRWSAEFRDQGARIIGRYEGGILREWERR